MSHQPHITALDELLSVYIDDRASAAERQQVEVLVASNPAAARQLAELRYAVNVVRETPRVPVPHAFTLSEAQVRSTRRWRWPSWLQPVYLRSAAAIMAVCLLVLLAGDLGNRSQLDLTGSQPAITQAEPGGLPVEEGDPSAVIGKRSTSDSLTQQPAAGSTGFLGLAPGVLLGLEITLAVLIVVLLAASWQMTRVT